MIKMTTHMTPQASTGTTPGKSEAVWPTVAKDWIDALKMVDGMPVNGARVIEAGSCDAIEAAALYPVYTFDGCSGLLAAYQNTMKALVNVVKETNEIVHGKTQDKKLSDMDTKRVVQLSLVYAQLSDSAMTLKAMLMNIMENAQ